MNALLLLLIRHGLASLGGFFAANNITGDSTTSIVVGLITLAIPTLWSWLAKALKLDEKYGFDIGKSELLRVLLGSLVSQGVTALSVYFSINADNPELLLGAVANAGASKLGLHQKLAFAGSKVVPLLLLSVSLLSLASCASFTKQDATRMAEQIGLSAGDTGILLARVRLDQAQQDLAFALANDPANSKTILLKQLGVQAALQALDAAEKAIAKQRARLEAKQPRDVTPGGSTTEHTEHTEMPECLIAEIYPRGQCNSGTTQSRPSPARAVKVMVSAASTTETNSREGRLPKGQVTIPPIPDYGTRVAALLAAQ